MDGNLKKLEEQILNYFSNTNKKHGKACLRVLDNKYRMYYTGVTLNYITYNLLKAKYRKTDVAKIILKLQMEDKIRSLFCPNVKQYVFETLYTGNYSFSPSTGTNDWRPKYNVHTYLKSFIKDE